MPVYRVNAILPATTGLPADAVMNTFHLSASPDDMPAALAAIVDFYEDIGERISVAIDRTSNGSFVVAYDLADPEPRVPVFAEAFTMPAASDTSALPTECAVCLSYRANAPSGAERGRYRGRIYIGPLVSDWVDMSGSYPRPAPTYVAQLADAASDLLATLGGLDAPWGVYSRVDAAFRPIQGGWVDNEFDTQRRRGRRATARTQWS